MRLHTVYACSARAVGKKIKYTNITREDQARDLKQAITLLNYARVITKMYHSSCSGGPLETGIDLNTYKILLLDIGLMNRSRGINWSELSQISITMRPLVRLKDTPKSCAICNSYLFTVPKAGKSGTLKSLLQFVYLKKVPGLSDLI